MQRLNSVLAVCTFVGLASAAYSDCPDVSETCFGYACPDPDPTGLGLKTRVYFCPAVECESSYSFAIASIMGGANPTCEVVALPKELQDGLHTEAPAPVWSGGTGCSSGACVSTSFGDAYAAACAKTNENEILMESKSGTGGPESCFAPVVAYASAQAGITISSLSPTSPTPCVEFDTPVKPAVITLTARLTTCGCSWVMSAPSGDLPSPGVTLLAAGSVVRTWTFCCPPIQPGSTFEIITIDSPILAWDLNNDGRFTPADLSPATISNALQTCTSSSNLDLECLGFQFDLNGDRNFDQDDLDIFADLFNCGIGTGLFGDANQDGRVNCDDLAAATIFPLVGLGTTPPSIPIGDPDYIFELDFDLDGLIDTNDETAFFNLLQACP